MEPEPWSTSLFFSAYLRLIRSPARRPLPCTGSAFRTPTSLSALWPVRPRSPRSLIRFGDGSTSWSGARGPDHSRSGR